jgi:hypothetical protein
LWLRWHQFNCDSLDIVLIVSVTREDLRDEFAMADEAFALSPISARATQPSEQDYDAIREAFMETSRGRWFLGEYAKRNRNADTRMVLDAVARIEETLAAQKTPAPDPRLAEALAGIRTALDEARAEASVALDDLALEEHLAPARKGARVIREIAWRLREIGADGRICDLIDSQLGAIEAACETAAAIDPTTALSAALDLIERRMAAFDESDTPVPQPVAETMRSSPQVAEEASFSPRAPEEVVASPFSATHDEAPAGMVETVPTRSAGVSIEAADAYDEALLDMIAVEMAAPDPVQTSDPSENQAYEVAAAELPPAAPIIVDERSKPVATPAVQPSPKPVSPSLEPSLGSSLIANGIVQRPRASRPDPLAPIRRLSQTEKIALFS